MGPIKDPGPDQQGKTSREETADLDHPVKKEKGRGVDVTTPAGKDKGKGEKVKMVETPIFVSFTKDSKLRKRLQEVDDTIGEATNSPGVRFVERCGGGTLIELLSSSNPRAKDWTCERNECLPCKGRLLLAGEEELRPVLSPGAAPLPKPSREDTKAVKNAPVRG